MSKRKVFIAVLIATVCIASSPTSVLANLSEEGSKKLQLTGDPNFTVLSVLNPSDTRIDHGIFENVPQLLLTNFEPICKWLPKNGRKCWKELTNRPGCFVWEEHLVVGQTVTWSGKCDKGISNGFGTLVRTINGNIEKLVGTITNGKQNGYWTETNSNGDVAEGPYVEGKKHGNWEILYPHSPSKKLKKGLYVEGKKHGDWFIVFLNDEWIKLPYVEGKVHGEWVYRYNDGRESKGPYVDGKKHGDWIVHYPDGTAAEGPYVDGKKHGDWIFHYPSGTEAEGPYVEDKRHGHWIFHYLDGTVAEGPYVEGKPHGDWIIHYRDGTVAEGPYVEGKRHGRWIINFPDSTVEERVYVEGKLSGQ